MAPPEAAKLSFVPLLALGINGIVGVGIFFASQSIAEGAPGHLGTALFVATAALLVPVGLSFAALARRFPEDGGPVAFARAAFGEGAAFTVGWVSYVSAVASTAAIIAGLVEAVLGRGSFAVEAAVLLAFALVAALGLALSSVAWTALTVLKLVPLLALVVASGFHAARAPVAAPAPATTSIWQAALVAVFAFQGFEIVPLVAGRARDGARTVPLAVLGSLGASAVLYALLHAGAVRALPALASSKAPLVDAAAVYGGDALARVVVVGTSVSAVGIAFGMVVMTPRYLASLRLPVVSRETPRQVPLVALLVTVALVAGLLALGTRRELFALSSVAVLAQYGATSLALLTLAARRREGLGPRHAALGLLALVLSLGLATVGATLREAGIAFGLLLVGLVVRGAALSRALSSPRLAFRPPRFDDDVDLAAHVAALPRDASTKGLFCQDYLDKVRAARPDADLFAVSGVAPVRYVSFKNYPYADAVRLQYHTAKLLWPDEPIGEALRRVGQSSYDAFLKSHVGRVIFGAFGSNFSMIARVGIRGWQVSLNFGEVTLDEISDHRARYRFRGMPIFIETVQLGVIEGAMRACGVSGTFRVDMSDLSNGVIEAEW